MVSIMLSGLLFLESSFLNCNVQSQYDLAYLGFFVTHRKYYSLDDLKDDASSLKISASDSRELCYAFSKIVKGEQLETDKSISIDHIFFYSENGYKVYASSEYIKFSYSGKDKFYKLDSVDKLILENSIMKSCLRNEACYRGRFAD